VTASDINLGNNDKERLPAFTTLLDGIRGWAGAVRGARALIYTAYRSNYNLWVGAPITSGTQWTERTEAALDSVTWSDRTLQATQGEVRGTAAESYGGDGRFGAVHLPIGFLQFYLNNETPDGGDAPLGNKLRGYHTGAQHGPGTAPASAPPKPVEPLWANGAPQVLGPGLAALGRVAQRGIRPDLLITCQGYLPEFFDWWCS
jgi:hypothetical protein